MVKPVEMVQGDVPLTLGAERRWAKRYDNNSQFLSLIGLSPGIQGSLTKKTHVFPRRVVSLSIPPDILSDTASSLGSLLERIRRFVSFE